jgi:hypothetical protein
MASFLFSSLMLITIYFTIFCRILSGGDKDFNDLVLKIEPVSTAAKKGTGLQGDRELIDLSGVTGTSTVNYSIGGDAQYNNTIGLYRIDGRHRLQRRHRRADRPFGKNRRIQTPPSTTGFKNHRSCLRNRLADADRLQ